MGPPTVDDMRQQMWKFDVFDYVVLAAILLGCALTGVYCSLRGKKDSDRTGQYLFGGRNMNAFPVAMSLVTSCMSGVMLLGIPAEIYLYGTEYAFTFIPLILTGIVASYLVLPVFHEMRLLSIYEYLERRFDKSVRFFGSFMFMTVQIFWLPMVVYLPGLAFSQVAGVNVHVVTPCICFLCVFYTCLGGLKAAVWSDVVQTLFMLASLILVCVKGSLDAGGFDEIWRINNEGGRLVVPTFEADLTIRHTFWAITVGGTVTFVQWSVLDQKMAQRFLSLPSLSHARRAAWMFVAGLVALISMSCYVGLVIYSVYRECDPLTTRLAREKDQLLPLLVMTMSSKMPGVPGLFLAGIFSASLSSLSTGLNSLSAVVLEDIIKPFLFNRLNARATNLIARGVAVIFGILFFILVLFTKKLEIILQVSSSMGSITSGPVLGIFVSGVLLPWVNAKGALFGGLLGLFASGFVIVGAQNAAVRNEVSFFPKPTSVEGCVYYYNGTVLAASSDAATGTVFPLFKLGYFWYTAFGGFITVALAFIISALTGFTDLRNVDPILLSPIIRALLPVSGKAPLSAEELLLRELKEIEFKS